MSLEEHNINNGDDYADILIQGIIEIEDANELDAEIVRCWCIELRKMCVEKYNNYIIGKEETFLLSEEGKKEAKLLNEEDI